MRCSLRTMVRTRVGRAVAVLATLPALAACRSDPSVVEAEDSGPPPPPRPTPETMKAVEVGARPDRVRPGRSADSRDVDRCASRERRRDRLAWEHRMAAWRRVARRAGRRLARTTAGIRVPRTVACPWQAARSRIRRSCRWTMAAACHCPRRSTRRRNSKRRMSAGPSGSECASAPCRPWARRAWSARA